MVNVALRGWDKLDMGNYKPSDAMPIALVGSVAAEMGDDEVVAAVDRTFADRVAPVESDGVVWYEGGSLLLNAQRFLGSVNRRDGFRDMVRGRRRLDPTTPHLAGVAYPSVLVARAVQDGNGGVDLVLRGTGGGDSPIEFAGLRAGRTYTLDCDGRSQSVTADAEGRVAASVPVGTRSEVQLRVA
jgi:hypothetical protein